MMSLVLKNPTVDINVVDAATGTNSFWYSSVYGFGDVMKLLAEAGADVLNCDHDGNNALHMACKNGNDKIVK
mgnify:CR=1 FL=1